MMRVFRTRTFTRWMRKSGVTDADLLGSVAEMATGLIDADLGRHVIKKRIALAGRRKSGGARTIVATNLGDRWYFMFGFSKNERSTIRPAELRALQTLAEDLLALDAIGIAAARNAAKSRRSDHESKRAQESRRRRNSRNGAWAPFSRRDQQAPDA
jgi:hypothetical protein